MGRVNPGSGWVWRESILSLKTTLCVYYVNLSQYCYAAAQQRHRTICDNRRDTMAGTAFFHPFRPGTRRCRSMPIARSRHPQTNRCHGRCIRPQDAWPERDRRGLWQRADELVFLIGKPAFWADQYGRRTIMGNQCLTERFSGPLRCVKYCSALGPVG